MEVILENNIKIASTQKEENNPDKIFHAKTFFITWLVFCLIALAGYLWGIDSADAGNRYSPAWVIFAFPIGPLCGFIGCALRGM